MTSYGDVPPEVLDQLRPICQAFPESYEEPAWAGVRWRVRQRTFAYTLTVDPGHQRSYARAAAVDRPTCVLTFRAGGDELRALLAAGPPFFAAPWPADAVGLRLDGVVDWEEVAELLTESYCLLAPRKLAARVDRPAG
ncbi:MmcQ/YjbR family DNA-binding protein [Micromonospora endolithica]|uniref:MmcQ/YjbR family DNA-binding protein n=1 Tax=Micromonospora endolithica TaxID=230091 RepID=A0A3A9YUN6_9ACTN|nr:MmcQ/YjbR family DNA-binding protein [Micromonospora endolithica]RKN39650.1 MmcQ/YjbR family DNA-binding protein [Micromonospora endolithica]